MSEFLPDIDIKTKSNAQLFLKNLYHILKDKEGFKEVVYKKDNIIYNSYYIQLIPTFQNNHKNIGALLLPVEEKENILRVEIMADRWYKENVTYDIYVNEAKRILLPILSEYNKKFNERRRLSIQSKESLKLKLPKVANDLFMAFVKGANKNILHPLDWKRFYVFVRHCYSKKVKLYHDDLKILLIENGFETNKAEYISDIFAHGIKILGTYYY